MILSILSALALSTGAPVVLNLPAQAIGCHPQPGKVMGCAASSHDIAQQRAMGTYRPAVALAQSDTAPRVACHPDPSRNRGCFRAVPGARVKPAMAEARANPAPAAPAHTAQADPVPSPEASRTSS